MKYVIFSDVHGNIYALKQMLLDISKYEITGFICCGDIVGYYYWHEDVIAILKELNKLIIIKGNHDEFCIKLNEFKANVQELKNKYTSLYDDLLSQSTYMYLKMLPACESIVIMDKNIQICHGSITDPYDGRIYPDTNIEKMDFKNADIVFLGHTHYRMVRKKGNTIIINPGSLGQPRDGKGFSYCIFDFDTLQYEFRTVDIDKEKIFSEIKKRDPENKYLIEVLERNCSR